MKYRSEIDGLRAIAVLPVIMFHAGFEFFQGGYVGVDIFFVISGYLITSIIINELRDQTFSIAAFYERRARRILPALFCVLLATCIASWFFLISLDFKRLFESVVAVVTFSSNIYFWLQADYFDSAAELKPLLHTWSLAVEEQYYIVFPLLMVAIWRFGLRVLVVVICLILITSLLYAQSIVTTQPMTAFYLLPSRAWELLIGALCAVYLCREKEHSPSTQFSQFASVVGVGLIVYAIFFFTKQTPMPSVHTLIPVSGAALLILYANKGTWVQNALSQRWLVGIGLISYSAYLWHQPILSLLRHNFLHEPPIYLLSCGAMLSLGLAWLTWKYIETPFRKKKTSRSGVFLVSGAIASAFMFVGLFVYFNPHLPFGNGQFNKINQEVVLLDYKNDNLLLRKKSWRVIDNYANTLLELPDSPPHNNYRDWFSPDDDRPNILLIGNSHSKDMFNVLFLSNYMRNKVKLGRFNVDVGDIGANHSLYENKNYKNSDVIIIATQFLNRRNDVKNLEEVVKRLLADSKKVVLVRNIFQFPSYLGGSWTLFDRVLHEHLRVGNKDPETIVSAANKAYFDFTQLGQKDENVITANNEIDRLGVNYPEILVVDRMQFMCSEVNKVCYSASLTLNKYYPDYGHYTLEGAAFFANKAREIGWFDVLLGYIVETENEGSVDTN